MRRAHLPISFKRRCRGIIGADGTPTGVQPPLAPVWYRYLQDISVAVRIIEGQPPTDRTNPQGMGAIIGRCEQPTR
jgi:hypothetical protein